ncbi:MAG: hypothetical protein EP330_18365 [Deltaproteobacteria bacterium]|nr:MAG: hypothetical protein EP330_18365 [Deltaproteobacteria bacterium]
MLALLALLWTAPAQAGSDIEFQIPASVFVYVDGKKAAYTSRFRQRASDLEPGTHEVRVSSMFGKTLYAEDIEVTDNTLTIAEWERGELSVRTEKLEGSSEADDLEGGAEEVASDAEEEVQPAEGPVAEQASVEEPEELAPTEEPADVVRVEDALAEGVAPEEPEDVPPVDDAVAGFEPEEPPLPAGMVDPFAGIRERPLPEPDPLSEVRVEEEPTAEAGAVDELPTQHEPDASSSAVVATGLPERRVRVDAREGVALEIHHEGASLWVYVVDGELVVQDRSGMTFAVGER